MFPVFYRLMPRRNFQGSGFPIDFPYISFPNSTLTWYNPILNCLIYLWLLRYKLNTAPARGVLFPQIYIHWQPIEWQTPPINKTSIWQNVCVLDKDSIIWSPQTISIGQLTDTMVPANPMGCLFCCVLLLSDAAMCLVKNYRYIYICIHVYTSVVEALLPFRPLLNDSRRPHALALALVIVHQRRYYQYSGACIYDSDGYWKMLSSIS